MSIVNVVAAYNDLTPLDLRILRIIEVLHRNHEYVPLGRIVRYSRRDEDVVLKSLRRLNKHKLIVRRGVGAFRLTFPAYDILALHTMVKRGVVKSISPTPLGIGKESDVYAAETPDGAKLALKFHRLGRVSFRNVRKYRLWLGERRHITWLYEAKISAHMEYIALIKAYKANLPVPKPRAVTRHLVAMEYFDGIELYKYRLTNPLETFKEILSFIEGMVKASMVHGDLTEYNILIRPSDEEMRIIDWPQWMYSDVRGADQVLKRDLAHLVNYFNRMYDLGISINDTWGVIGPLLPKVKRSPDKAYSRLLSRLIEKLS